MFQIIIQEEVIEDMASACNWYETQRAGLDNELVNEVNKTLLKLSQHPQYYSYLDLHYRRIKINRFPYYFLYEVRGNLVVVYQFYHAKQNRNLR